MKHLSPLSTSTLTQSHPSHGEQKYRAVRNGTRQLLGDENRLPMMSRLSRLSVVLIAALSTSACVYPYLNYTRQQTMDAGNGIHDPAITDIETAQQLIAGLAAELQKARNDRNVARTVLAEVIFYGSLLAVYGIASQKAGARNAGAGIAGISSALDSHYGLAAQQLAIGNASSRASCLQDAINGIDTATLALFDEGKYVGDLGTLEANKALQSIPDDAIAAVKEISNQLANDLSAVNLTATSLAEVKDIADKFSKDANDAGNAKVPSLSKGMQATLTELQEKADTAKKNRIEAAGRGGFVIETSEAEDIYLAGKAKAAIEMQKKATFLRRVLIFSSASQACIKLAVKAG